MMQRRPVDILRPMVDRAIQQNPGDAHLQTVGSLVQALENILWPPPVEEAEAVLALPPAVLDGMERNFFLTLLVVVAMTGDSRLFEAFRDRYADSLAAHNDVEASWRHLDERIVELSDSDTLNPTFAQENLSGWRRCALLIAEFASGKLASSPTDALGAAMTHAYRSCARMILLNFQAYMDGALSELSAGGVPNEARSLIDMAEEHKRLPDIFLEDRRTHLPNRGDVFVDAFPIFLARQFQAVQYDIHRRGEDITPRLTSLHRGLDARITQVRFLFDLYGHPRRPTDPPPNAPLPTRPSPNVSVSNAPPPRQSTLRSIARPISFVDHDDFVRLLSAVFLESHKLLQSNPVAATVGGWDAVTQLIEDYTGTFTAHSGIDLTDEGPNYLRTTFPRTIAGELLHDCAVYAAVVCYWLLNLERLLERKHQIKLGLEAWFITLPVHLALLVKVNPEGFPSDVKGLPTGGILVVHNNHVHRKDAKELGDIMNSQWKDAPPPQDVDPKDAATLNHKFLEDIAAALFIDGVDMPLSSKRVLKPGAGPNRDAVWNSLSEYMNRSRTGKIFTRQVQKGVGRFAQFHLKYLEILMERAKFFNAVLVKELWNNRAPALYASIFREETDWPDAGHLDSLRRYVDQITPLHTEFWERLQAFIGKETDARNEITKILEDNSARIISADARRSFSERLPFVAGHGLQEPLKEIQAHTNLCKDYLSRKASGNLATDPPRPPYMAAAMRERIL
jgi:hypothetical protein